jgi:hypothetical protein
MKIPISERLPESMFISIFAGYKCNQLGNDHIFELQNVKSICSKWFYFKQFIKITDVDTLSLYVLQIFSFEMCLYQYCDHFFFLATKSSFPRTEGHMFTDR